MARKEGWLGTDAVGGWIDYPDVGVIYDKDVAEFVVRHLSLKDRLNTRKIAIAALYAQLMLMKVVDMPEDPDFKW